MQFRDNLLRLIARFLYSSSMPREIAFDLGIKVSPLSSLKHLVALLGKETCQNLKSWMPRAAAEASFKNTVKKEVFSSCTLFSYHFSEGWVVVVLHFDKNACLRRAFFQCPACQNVPTIELQLKSELNFPAFSDQMSLVSYSRIS